MNDWDNAPWESDLFDIFVLDEQEKKREQLKEREQSKLDDKEKDLKKKTIELMQAGAKKEQKEYDAKMEVQKNLRVTLEVNFWGNPKIVVLLILVFFAQNEGQAARWKNTASQIEETWSICRVLGHRIHEGNPVLFKHKVCWEVLDSIWDVSY